MVFRLLLIETNVLSRSNNLDHSTYAHLYLNYLPSNEFQWYYILCFERTSTTATYICYWDIKVIKNWKHFDHQTIPEVWSLQENSVCIWSNMSFSIVQSCISLWTLTLCSKSMFIYIEIFTNVIYYSRKSYPIWHLSIIGQRE